MSAKCFHLPQFLTTCFLPSQGVCSFSGCMTIRTSPAVSCHVIVFVLLTFCTGSCCSWCSCRSLISFFTHCKHTSECSASFLKCSAWGRVRFGNRSDITNYLFSVRASLVCSAFALPTCETCPVDHQGSNAMWTASNCEFQLQVFLFTPGTCTPRCLFAAA